MPIAVIALEFDPLLRVGDLLIVRWQTLALALVIVVCLAAAGVLARREGLRADDLLFIAIGAAPGAIVGGRLGYWLMVPEAFGGRPLALLDPSVGGLELGLAVVGGIGTAWIVATLLGETAGRWARVTAIPLLVAIGAGKLTMVLGGSGQGRPFDGDWGTAYLGPGPWLTIAPALPSHPAQVYEAIGTALIALLVALARSLDLFRSERGSRLLLGVAGWCAVRALVSTTWRDPPVVAGIPAGGLIAIGIVVVAVVGVLVVNVWRQRPELAPADIARPAWPDPERRQRF